MEQTETMTHGLLQLLYIIDKYNDSNMGGSVAACIFKHCESMC